MRLVRRDHIGWQQTAGSIAIALAITLALTFLTLWLTSGKPLEATWQLLSYPWQAATPIKQWGKALNVALYLSLIALGLSVSYRANVWNIGAEGQFAMGAIFAFGAWLGFGSPVGAWFLPLLLIFGVVGGLVWAAIPAALRTFANTNELLVSLMLFYIAAQFLFFLSNGPWETLASQKPVPTRTDMLPDALQLPDLFVAGSKLHVGLLIGGGVILGLSLFLSLTLLGYRLSVASQSPRAERFAGFSPKGTIWIAFLISGGCAGLAGALFLSGDVGFLVEQSNFLRGYGFAAIIVAFLGRLNPLGLVLAGLALGYIEGGAGWLSAKGLGDDSVSHIIQVIALFSTLGTAFFVTHRIEWRSR